MNLWAQQLSPVQGTENPLIVQVWYSNTFFPRNHSKNKSKVKKKTEKNKYLGGVYPDASCSYWPLRVAYHAYWTEAGGTFVEVLCRVTRRRGACFLASQTTTYRRPDLVQRKDGRGGESMSSAGTTALCVSRPESAVRSIKVWLPEGNNSVTSPTIYEYTLMIIVIMMDSLTLIWRTQRDTEGYGGVPWANTVKDKGRTWSVLD